MNENGKPKAESASIFKNIVHNVPDDDVGKMDFPLLWEILTPIWRANVMTRQPGRLSVNPDGSLWRVSIVCPTEKRQTAVYVTSLCTLFAEVEVMLKNGTPHWGLTWQEAKKNLPTLDDLVK